MVQVHALHWPVELQGPKFYPGQPTPDMCQDYLTRPLPHIEPTPLISLFS